MESLGKELDLNTIKNNLKLSILYVEDEEDILYEIFDILKFVADEDQLFVARNGEEALKIYMEKHPDIVISDIEMPLMDGIQLAKKIKEIDPKQNIIFTTAYTLEYYLLEAIKLHVNAYLLKPLILDELMDEIKKIAYTLILEQEITKKDELLMQKSKMAAMGEMLANIAHQWRQPLSIISTLASTLQYRYEFDLNTITKDLVDKDMGNIVDQANYLSQTIEDFKEFLKDDKDLEEVSIVHCINNTIKLVHAALKNNHIELLLELDEDHVIKSNEHELVQGFINIINNAKDVLRDNMQNHGDKVIKVKTMKVDDKFIVKICDNGGGIDDSVMEKIFQPYFTTKGDKDGTGLGLAMTKTIFEEKNNIKIDVENKELEHNEKHYRGACFTMRFI